MPGYSLFDVKKADARRVVEGLTGVDFVGHKLHAEIADPEKDYSRASSRRKKERQDSGKKEKNGNFEKFMKKGKSSGSRQRKR